MYYIFNKDGICIASSNKETDIDDHNTRNEIVIETIESYDISTIILTDNKITIKNTIFDINTKAKEIRSNLRNQIDVFLLPAATYKDELVSQENKDKLIQDSLLLAKWPNTKDWPMIALPTLSDYANEVLTIPVWPPKD